MNELLILFNYYNCGCLDSVTGRIKLFAWYALKLHWKCLMNMLKVNGFNGVFLHSVFPSRCPSKTAYTSISNTRCWHFFFALSIQLKKSKRAMFRINVPILKKCRSLVLIYFKIIAILKPIWCNCVPSSVNRFFLTQENVSAKA